MGIKGAKVSATCRAKLRRQIAKKMAGFVAGYAEATRCSPERAEYEVELALREIINQMDTSRMLKRQGAFEYQKRMFFN